MIGMMREFKCITSGITFLALGFFAAVSGTEIFPTPESLKDNVAFWKKIYTEVSLKEGLLHDKEYPLVIYKKIRVVTQVRRQRSRIIDNERDRVKALLSVLTSQPESSWSPQARKIAELYRQHAPKGAISGAYGRVRFQQGQMERFREGLHRSTAYLDSIKTIFAQYRIPKKLIYLPHVESSFNPDAYSKVGAAGLWQFMRGTGKQYLKINYSIDERRDPILSTYAAAKLLSYNYRQIKSWPLAITAYNHGLAGMKRAVASTGSRDIEVIINKHRSRTFKFASKNFYSCFLAASEIAQNPDKYFSKLTYAKPLSYHDIVLDFFVSPRALASSIGISERELHKLNPALRSVVFSHNKLIPKGATIHIPRNLSMAKVSLALKNIPDSLKVKAPPRPKYYRVRRGDNLYAIAYKLGVSAKSIAYANNISRMNRIYAGQVLVIPGGTETKKKKEPLTIASVTTAKEKSKSSIPAKELKPKAKSIEKKVVRAKKEKNPVPVKIEKSPSNDKVPVQEAVPESLEVILRASAEYIPQSKVSFQTAYSYKFDAEIYDLDVTFHNGNSTAKIKVAVDETLGHYANWLAVATQRIRTINRMGRRSHIRLNQMLKIPVNKETAELFSRRRLEYHMALEEDFYSQYKVTELKPKTIKTGETLWHICNQDDTIPLWLLKKYNKHIDFGQLFPNMKIWLPVVEEITEQDRQLQNSAEWRGVYPGYQEPLSQVKPIQLIP